MRTLHTFLLLLVALSAMAQADLSLTGSVSNPTPGIYTYVTFTVTITNSGPQTATNITVQRSQSGGIVPQGSNPGTVSVGTFNTLSGFWSIPSLASGQSATWTLNHFVTTSSPEYLYGYVTASSPSDPDSDPTNSVCCTNLPDDEVLVQVNAGTPPAQPDLRVSSSSLVASATSGTSLSSTVVVKNFGTATTGALSKLRVYLSTNNTLSADDVELTSTNFNTLAAGTQQSKSVPVPVPAGVSGVRFVLYVADADGVIAENNETNNVLAKQVTFTAGTAKPDLTVLNTVEALASVEMNADFSVKFSVKNQSTTTVAGASAAKVYLSTNTTISADDVLLAIQPMPVLAAGATFTQTIYNVAALQPGNYYLLIRADADGQVTESSESNNLRTKAFQITGPSVDVGIASVTVNVYNSPQNIGRSAYIQNNTLVESPAMNIEFYASANSSLDASDELLSTELIPPLGANALYSTSWNTSPTPASFTNGGFYVIARLDPMNAVAETDEANNIFVQLVAPDLTGSNTMSFSTNVPYGENPKYNPGNQFFVSVQQGNVGNWFVGDETVHFYMSADYTLSADDVLLGNKTLPSGQGSVNFFYSPVLTIPASTGVGLKYLIYKLDANNVYAELDENNNVFAAPFEVVTTAAPDLAITSVTMPTGNVIQGTPFNASITIKNFGNAISYEGMMYVTEMLDTSSGYAFTGGTTMGILNIPQIGAGQSQTFSVSLTPYSPTGSYWAQFYLNSVSNEFQLANNITYRPFSTIEMKPDLTFVSSTVTQNGTNLQWVATIKNIGLVNSAATDARLYMSDLVGYAYNTMTYGPLSTMNIPALNVNGTFSINTTIPIPQGFQTGDFRFMASADYANALVETSELNNTDSDTLSLIIAEPVYSYINLGSGIGDRVRQTDTGFQIIGVLDTLLRVVNTNQSGQLVSSWTMPASEGWLYFGQGKNIVKLVSLDSANLALKVYNETGTLHNTYPIASQFGNIILTGGVFATADGNYTFSASVKGTSPDPSSGQPYSYNPTAMWVGKVTTAGSLLWQDTTLFSGYFYQPRGITQANNGDLIYCYSSYTNYLGGYWAVSTHRYSNAGNTAPIDTDTLNGGYNGGYGSSETLSNGFKPVGNSSYFTTSSGAYWGTHGSTYYGRLNRFEASNSTYSKSLYLGLGSPFFSGQIQFLSAVATPDNGCFVVGNYSLNDNFQLTLFRLKPDNTEQFVKAGPGPMYDIIRVNNNLYALTGKKDSNMVLVFIDSLGNNAPAPTGGGGPNGADLALNIAASNPTPGVYTNVTFTATLTNQGNQTANTIVVSVPIPSGIAYTSHTTTAGTLYSNYSGNWTIPSLGAGQSVTLNLVLFTLGGAPKTVYGQVTACATSDTDSQPNNGTPPTPSQDDEAAATIDPPGAPLVQQLGDEEVSDVMRLFPNPTTGLLNIEVMAAEGASCRLRLLDITGHEVMPPSTTDAPDTLQLDLTHLPTGPYILVCTDGSGRILQRQILMKN